MNIKTEIWNGLQIRFVEKEPGDWWAVAADVVKTVYKRCTSWDLPSFKSGNSRRIRREAFLEWMQRLEAGDAS